MPVFNNILAGAAGQSGGAGDYTIERSLRFDSGSSSYLSRTPSSAGNRKTWTYSFWLKRGKLSTYVVPVSAGSAGSTPRTYMRFDVSTDRIRLQNDSGFLYVTDANFRDPSAWYHIVWVVDTTDSTPADRVKLYINGVRVTNWATETTAGLNEETYFNSTSHSNYIGAENRLQFYFDGYLADVHFLDGIAISDPDGVFGEIDADTGVWNPIEYTGDYNVAGTPGTQYSTTSTISGASGLFDGDTTNHVSQAMDGSYKTVTTEPITFTLNNGTFTYSTNNCGATGGNNNRYLRLTRQSDGVTTELTSTDCNGWTIPNAWTGITISKIEWKRWSSYENISAVYVDSTMLVDSGTPAGVNGFHLDVDPDAADSYSGDGTFTGNTAGTSKTPEDLANAFDGDITTYARHNSVELVAANTDIVLNYTFPGTGVDVSSSLRVYVASYSHVSVNGGSTEYSYSVTSGGEWIDVSAAISGSNFKLTSLNIRRNIPAVGNYRAVLAAVEVDGKILIDGVGPGVDASGNGNHWKANNFQFNSQIYATGDLTAVNGVLAPASNPFWIDILPTNADMHYASSNNSDNMLFVHDGLTSTSAYWVGNLNSPTYGGNVKRARFDLRSFGNITSCRVYGGFAAGYVNYKYRMLDSSKTEIAGSDGTFGVAGWHSMQVTGNPEYLEISCEHTTSTDTRHRTYAIEVNGVVLVNGGPHLNDSFIDSPTNYDDETNIGGNYATFNAVNNTATLENGNLVVKGTGSHGNSYATMGITSGKIYWEITKNSTSGTVGVIGFHGLSSHNTPKGTTYSDPGANADQKAIYLTANAIVCNANGLSATGHVLYASGSPALPTGWITAAGTYMFCVDMDNQKAWIGKDGVWWGSTGSAITTTGGDPANGTNPLWLLDANDTYFPFLGPYITTVEFNANFGQRGAFVYTPPTGFKSLCTQNLDDPLIEDPSTAFDATIWSGDGVSGRDITTNHSPDLVWIKRRNSSNDWNILFDSIRGGEQLSSNEDDEGLAQGSNVAGYVSAYNSDGFELTQGSNLNSVNATGGTYVGWTWDGGDLATTSDTTNYNQDSEWSATAGTGFNNPANAFDGSLSTGGTISSSGSDITVTTASFTGRRIRFYKNGNSEGTTYLGVNGTDHAFPSSTTATGWVEVDLGSATNITSLTTSWSPGSYTLYAVEVDGKRLIDPGVIPAGSLNSSVYNQDQVWSTYGTFTGSYFSGTYDWANVFSADNNYGNTGSLYVAAGGTLAKWVLTSSLTCNSEFKFYCYNNTTITLNEGLSDEVTSTSTGGQSFHYHTIPFSGQIQSVKMDSTVTYLIRLFVDGKALIDNGITMPSVPSIASTVRANPTAGISVVSYTGNLTSAGNAGIAHGLNTAPSLIISKDRDNASPWIVQHKSLGANEYLQLNNNSVPANSSSIGAGTLPKPTSNVFYGSWLTGLNTNSNNHITYCFSPVKNFSAFGTYEGNQNPNNGAVIWTGFTPAFILVKYVDSAGQWYIYDHLRSPNNVAYQALQASQSDQENTSSANFQIDILSSGFKMRQSNGPNNNGTYVWAAFAKTPFKYARAY